MKTFKKKKLSDSLEKEWHKSGIEESLNKKVIALIEEYIKHPMERVNGFFFDLSERKEKDVFYLEVSFFTTNHAFSFVDLLEFVVEEQTVEYTKAMVSEVLYKKDFSDKVEYDDSDFWDI